VGNTVEKEWSSNDPVELVGGVFSSSKSVPAGVSDGLARDFSLRSVGNSSPESSCTVILVSNGNSARRKTTSIVNDLVSRNNDVREVVGFMFFSSE